VLGHTHSLSAAVVFLGVATPLAHVQHLSPVTLAIGTVVAAGAGLLPDLDHPQATPARAFGPPSALLARAICHLSGGHRHGTHSLIGMGVFTALALATTLNAWALTATIWLCMGLAARALWKHPRNRPNGRLDYGDVAGLVHAAVAFYIAYRLTHSGLDLGVIPWAVAIGYVTHLLGDSMTETGVNWLWPNPRRFRIGTIDTDSVVERWIVIPALYVGLAGIVYVTYPAWWPVLLQVLGPAG
jgi:membrane-bound metal-dependent hydrolase YbcI (DUF457 family)